MQEDTLSPRHGLGLASLKALRNILDGRQSLTVMQSGGVVTTATFTFGEPAPLEVVARVEQALGIQLPAAYRDVLLYCNGVVLYKDDEYAQWGFWMYDADELVRRYVTSREHYGEDWPPTIITFAEWFGDSDVLALDTGRPTFDGTDCVVLDGFSGRLPRQWKVASNGFGSWLDHLIVAQGTKYWLWS